VLEVQADVFGKRRDAVGLGRGLGEGLHSERVILVQVTYDADRQSIG
jgi:hypothetical protein